MITPFDTTFAEEFIVHLPEYIDDTKSEDTVSFFHEHCFKKALPWDDACTENKDGEQPLELDLCHKIWIGACLLDACLNHTDYGRETLRYAEQYRESIKSLDTALNKSKKKLFKSIPVYDLAEIIQNATDALDYVLMADAEDENGDYLLSELGEEMKKAGKLEDFERSVIDLQVRLSDFTEY